MVDLVTEERRTAGVPERRRYNRRVGPDVSPPYYEVFDRIATALEGIQRAMSAQESGAATVVSTGARADKDAAQAGFSEH